MDFEGGESDYLATHKGISADQAQQMLERVTGVAADAGLEYRFDLLKHTNTVKAHELLHFAKEQGRQLETAERLMSGVLHRGPAPRAARTSSSRSRPRRDSTRMPRASALESGATLPRCAPIRRRRRAYGINGVPFFVIDGKYGVSGAQPAEASRRCPQVAGERDGAARMTGTHD